MAERRQSSSHSVGGGRAGGEGGCGDEGGGANGGDGGGEGGGGEGGGGEGGKERVHVAPLSQTVSATSSRLASPSTKMLAVLRPEEQPEMHTKAAYVLPPSADHSTAPAQPSLVGLRTCTPTWLGLGL